MCINEKSKVIIIINYRFVFGHHQDNLDIFEPHYYHQFICDKLKWHKSNNNINSQYVVVGHLYIMN